MLLLHLFTGSRITANKRILSKRAAKPRVSEDLSPLELLRKENELLRETINSADKDIEELEAQLQVWQFTSLSALITKAWLPRKLHHYRGLMCCNVLQWARARRLRPQLEADNPEKFLPEPKHLDCILICML